MYLATIFYSSHKIHRKICLFSDVLLRQMILYLVVMEALLQKGALTVMPVQLDPNVPLQNLQTTNSVQMVHIR